MKKIILLLMALIPVAAIAQETVSQDTTLFVNGRKIVIKEQEGKVKVKLYENSSQGDTIENDQIFEGVYKDGQSTERRTVLTVPFKTKRSGYHFDPHAAGFYMGYTRLGSGFLNFDGPNYPQLKLTKSWEIGFNLFQGSTTISRNKHWGLTSALGWGYRSFQIKTNDAFVEVNGITTVVPGIPDRTTYSESRLRYFYFRLPLAIEWQKSLGGRIDKGPLFFSVSPELEIRHGIKSKAKVNGSKENLASGLNVHPIGINLVAQGGYGNVGAYLRYSTYSLFEKNNGPELYPLSFGLCLYW